ncbi:hypothetical protein BC936DRAFT_137380 [Jimgerdemannia flammicorona]|uniref:cysteine--tRNA ligase n=1 Tax=Jimgerdemannia flammicorona TaxID=994334 RepID=A0A433DJF7_9FUNG|nr:hypothetical protein BC936DRAFT_137380 [Jimgerdemannia flammicorona]
MLLVISCLNRQATLHSRPSYFRHFLARTSTPHPIKNMATNATQKIQQPPWHKPVPSDLSVLKLQNSLTKTKTEFIPKDGRRVTWYNCGPTVYDASHIGHARNYLTMDILRRVLEEYFKYDVLFVQNITDIDDKIIVRARQAYIYTQYKDSVLALSPALISEVRQAWRFYAESKLAKINGAVAEAIADWKQFESNLTPEELTKAVKVEEKFKMHVAALKSSHNALVLADKEIAAGDNSKESADRLIEASKDVLATWLDKQRGAEVNDPRIFRDLPAFWEADFFGDMESLNIRPPDIQTRVSEYVPEIITYVQKIVDNGYAYVADGSVYFDTARYDAHDEHHYAKLEPWSRGNIELIEDGEGSLGAKLQGKWNANDFALWKKSKPGEPKWGSPWGDGRPGWHIECSVMASQVLGNNMDIHSGGVDLAFPHHDNELAQAEAYFDCAQWVNYFLHAGHLHVEGQKMSKSLKNFISIKEALKKYSPRQLRLFFLMHQWDAKIDFGESSMHETISLEATINNFFVNIKALGHELRGSGSRCNDELQDGGLMHRYREAEKDLIELLSQKQRAVHVALCDSINTPAVLTEIMELITKTNIYLSAKSMRGVNLHVVEKVAKWITGIIKVFGLSDGGPEIGFSAHGQSGTNIEEAVMPYLRTLSAFRDNVRDMAREQKPHTDFLKLSDKLRDVDLVDLGVSLDDQEDGKALVKLVPREDLIKVREAKQAREAEKAAKKAAMLAEQEAKRVEKLERGRVAPEQMFLLQTAEFSKFDEQGIPTHDCDGAEIAKSRRKKLQKEWEVQKKIHMEYLDWQRSNGVA